MTRLVVLGLFALLSTLTAQQTTRPPRLPLVEAAEAGDALKVRMLLDAGADPNSPASFSAFEAACAGAFPDVVREMLAKQANVKARDSAGRTALNMVAKRAVGDKRENPAMVAKLLIDAGADANAQDNIYGNAALHEVVDAATARVLIQGGANFDLQNRDGQTPLMLTLDEDVTRALLEAGADMSIRDKKGKTVMDLARELELTEKIAVLKQFMK